MISVSWAVLFTIDWLSAKSKGKLPQLLKYYLFKNMLHICDDSHVTLCVTYKTPYCSYKDLVVKIRLHRRVRAADVSISSEGQRSHLKYSTLYQSA